MIIIFNISNIFGKKIKQIKFFINITLLIFIFLIFKQEDLKVIHRDMTSIHIAKEKQMILKIIILDIFLKMKILIMGSKY
jgi:hypothetical protein